MMKLLGRLKLWQKLGLLVIALALPTVIVGTLYVRNLSTVVSSLDLELDGGRYIERLSVVLNEVVSHRGRAAAHLSGDATAKERMLAIQTNVTTAIQEVEAAEFKLSSDATARWSTIKADWASLQARMASMLTEEAIDAHNVVIAQIMNLQDVVALESGLSADSNVSTSSLIAISMRDVPAALNFTAVVRNRAVLAALTGYISDGSKAVMKYNEAAAKAAIDKMELQLQGLRGDKEAFDAIEPAVQKIKVDVAAYRDYLATAVLGAEIKADSAAVYGAGDAARLGLADLASKATTAMTLSLDQRLDAARSQRLMVLTMTLGLLGVALALAWVITRAMTTPMAQAVSLFGAIAAGRYDNKVDVTGTDEAGQVLSALGDMQGKLRSQIESERKQAMENTRIRQALDKVSTNVVLADSDNTIIYVNEAAEHMFTRNESEMRRTLPGLSARQLRGSRADVLCKDDSQKHRFAQLTSADVEESTYGACTFRVVVNPVRNDQGERLGTVFEWTDRTQEVAVEQEVGRIVGGAVDGDLQGRISLDGKSGFFEKLAVGMNGLLENMSSIVVRIRDSALDVQTGAEEISQGNANLSQRTEEQASSLEETASSIEEMTSTVKQNADNAGQANQLAVAARDQADKGGAVVSRAVKAMAEINESSNKIADIIGVIDEIAFQTNLLALNAAVEAARAGEQGRGFAVVASEVRSLAQRSATAAKEIKDLIQDSVKRVDEGTNLVSQSGQTLEHIVSSVKKVSDIVAEIAAASQEQSAGIEQVNKAVMQLDELTQQNAALVEEAAAASESMADQARGLGAAIGRYKVLGGSTSAAASTAREVAAPAKATPTVNAATERRKGSRPWSGRTANAAAKSAPAPAAKKAATGTNDAEWSEF